MSNDDEVMQIGEKAVRSVPADAQQRLSRWFQSRLGEKIWVTEFERPSDGFSGDTFLVRLSPVQGGGGLGQRFVVRSDVRENIMIPLRDFSYLHKVQECIRRSGQVPVPKVLYVEDGTDVLGAPFYVSEFVEGLAPGDSRPYTLTGWVSKSTPEQLRSMVFSGIETLARLHAVDWEAQGLGFLRRADDAAGELQADLAYYVECCDWAYGGRWRLIDHACDWLRSCWPKAVRLKFSWGDSRLGNMLWRNHEPVAVLDWDWASIGDPGRDLGYWLFSHYYFCHVLPGLPLGWPSREETIQRYEAVSGNAVPDIQFYEAFGCFRQLTLMIRVAKLMQAAGTAPSEDFVENNPIADCMRSIIDN